MKKTTTIFSLVRLYSLLLLLALPLPLLVASSTNSTYAGKVILVKGKAIAVSDTGKERKLKRRAQIFTGDTIKTSKKSSMRLVMVDQSLLSLKAESVLKVADYKFSFDKKEKDSMALDLLKGGMRSVTGVIGVRSKKKFRINTPTATLGVRGTALEVIIDEDNQVVVTFDFGSGYAKNNSGLTNIGNLRSATIKSLTTKPVVYKSLPRNKWDPTVVARNIASLKPASILTITDEITASMTLSDRVLLVGLLDQAPGMTTSHVVKVVEGLITADPASAQAILMTATGVNRARAALLLQSAVLGGLPVADALKFVMSGLMYPLPAEIKAVMVEAVKAGITKEDAEKILRESAEADSCT